MKKIVINVCYGGFNIGDLAMKRYAELKGVTLDSYYGISRDDPVLVQVVEELGAKANGSCASLKVVEIPDEVSWEIEEYDGIEWVSEVHRTWC